MNHCPYFFQLVFVSKYFIEYSEISFKGEAEKWVTFCGKFLKVKVRI